MPVAPVNDGIPTLAGLGLPRTVLELALEAILRKGGLILVAGARGSGISSTVAAMLGFLNRRTCVHIVTLEEEMRYLHRPDTCIVSQCRLSPEPDSRPIERLRRYQDKLRPADAVRNPDWRNLLRGEFDRAEAT